MVLFIDHIFKNSIQQKGLGCRIVQPLAHWIFEALRKNQKLDQEFEKFGSV